MGFREQVTTTLVIIALIHIACRHCMPRTPRKASLKRYLNDLKPVKNNPVPTPYSPSRVNKKQKQIFGNAAQNGRITQTTLPETSLYKTYNFPENEFPLDNSPRDPFKIGMKFNENHQVNTLQKACNLQNSAINVLKKEIKMKRKLLSNKQVSNENSQMKTDTSSIKFASSPDSIRLFNSETFPEVQYPLNTMDTWGPNYWNYLPFTQDKQLNELGRPIFNSNSIKENLNKPFARLTKANASKFLQSYDKLKEQSRTATENSKRSNAEQKGLNFTKTATCESDSDDFIIAGLVSNILSDSTEMKKVLESTNKITPSSENTCPVTENPYNPMPIPYKVIEKNIENICPPFELKNNTEELHDMEKSVIAQTLQLIEEILLNEDISSAAPPGNYSKEVDRNVNSSDCTDVPANENIPTLTDSSKSYTVSHLQNNVTSLPVEIVPENIKLVAGPLNVRMPLPFTDPITPVQIDTLPLSNCNAVPGSTSIIIIPTSNNAVANSQSHVFETPSDIPIIVFLPSTQSSDIPSQIPHLNQVKSLSQDNTVLNNQLHNVFSNMAPLQNDDPTSNALIKEFLKGISNSGSSLPIYATLPTNSTCYNNENSPSSTREKSISDISIQRSLTDDAPFITPTCDDKLSQQPTETGNTDMLPPISDFEHPLFHFAGSDFTSLSHGPFNNILNNELPITAREINSDQQITNVSCKDLFIPTQNVTPEYLHKDIYVDNILEDSMSIIPNDALTVALDKNLTSETQIYTLKNTPLPEPRLKLPVPMDKSISTPPMSNKLTESLPQPTEASLSPSPVFETLSNKFPALTDVQISSTPVSDTTTESAPQPKANTPSPFPIMNSSSMTTDMTLKTELYKIRQILDKMLSSENPIDSQIAPMDTTLSPNSESGSLPLLINRELQSSPTPNDSLPQRALDRTFLPLSKTDRPIDSLQPQVHETLPLIPADETPTDTLPLPVDKLLVPNILLETYDPTLPIDDTVPLMPISETPANNNPYLIDNLVTSLSGTDASRTKDTNTGVYTHTIDNLPLKMDIPDLLKIPGDNLPISVNDFLMQLGETPHSEGPVDNPSDPIDEFSFPIEVFETVTLKVPDVVTIPMGGSVDQLPEGLNKTDKAQIDSYKDPLPQQEIYSPSSLDKLIPDFSLHDGKITKNPHSTADIKGQPLIVDVNPVTLVTPTAVSLSKGLQPTNVDKSSDEVLSESTLSNIPRVDLSLPIDHMLPFPDDTPTNLLLTINKTSSTSKLPITKALFQNVLSDITKGGLLPSPVARPFPVPSSLLDKTFYYVDIESPLSETKEISLVDKTLFKTETSGSSNDNLSVPEKTEEILPLPVDKMYSDNPMSDILTDVPLRMEETNKDKPDILTDNVLSRLVGCSPLLQPTNLDETSDEVLSESTLCNIPRVNLSLTIDHMLPFPDDTPTDLLLTINKTSSTSKLPITKALLQNILSDITKRGLLPSPVATPFPVPSSLLDKTFYCVDVESPLSETKEISLVDKTLSKTEISGSSTDNLSVPEKTEEILPLPVDKMYSDNPISDIVTDVPLRMEDTNKDKPDILTDKIENPDRTETLSLDNPEAANKVSLPIDTLSTSLTNKKIPSSSKLPITKVHLENTRGFSLPVSAVLPVTSPSVSENMLYSLESTVSDSLEDRPPLLTNTALSDQPTDSNLPFSGQSENTLPLEVDKTVSKYPSSDISLEISTPLVKLQPTSNDDLTSPMAKIRPLPKDTSSDLPLPNIKTPSSLKLPITKVLLENVLSDINTRGLSMPVAKSLPVAPRSQLDKTLYFLEFPSSEITEERSLTDIARRT